MSDLAATNCGCGSDNGGSPPFCGSSYYFAAAEITVPSSETATATDAVTTFFRFC